MLTTVVYTVCSVNDLARAITFAQSLRNNEPDMQLYIGLTDKVKGRFDPKRLLPTVVVEVADLFIPELSKMSSYYSVLELNCAMKSFFGGYLLETFCLDNLLYFDTDILIYKPLDMIKAALLKSSIVLTPHVQLPFPADNKKPSERSVLRAGLYNGGFLGFRNDHITRVFFEWWKERMKSQAFLRPADGMFLDQNWLNLVPLYFDNVTIIKDPGHNVAFWNLHERHITSDNGLIFVNDVPLSFFHFSGLDPFAADISKHQDRFELSSFPVLEDMFRDYRQKLIINGYEEYRDLACEYGIRAKELSISENLFIKLFRFCGYTVKKSAA